MMRAIFAGLLDCSGGWHIFIFFGFQNSAI
jgi:hypothetical protein